MTDRSLTAVSFAIASLTFTAVSAWRGYHGEIPVAIAHAGMAAVFAVAALVVSRWRRRS